MYPKYSPAQALLTRRPFRVIDINMSIYEEIERPRLIVDEDRVRDNIEKMAEKARLSRVVFRPHFKTHQSRTVGRWFRDYGVDTITVSSLSMASYFADDGWNDITVAFPFNIREAGKAAELAERIRLNVLLLDAETAEALDGRLSSPVGAWIKIDTGYGRTGIPWQEGERVQALARRIKESKHLNFDGLLTHAGHSYHLHKFSEKRELFALTADRLQELRGMLRDGGIEACELSVGDTPTSMAMERLEGVDEIRPGNFIYFDAQQYHIGSCNEEQIAAVVACPVVAVHMDRNECILYGGAVHLSAQPEEHPAGGTMYGYGVRFDTPGEPDGSGPWGRIDPDTYLRKVSQEHGVLRCGSGMIQSIRPGDLLAVVPVHSCLAVDLLGDAMTSDGMPIELGRFT